MSTDDPEFETVRGALDEIPDDQRADALAALGHMEEQLEEGRAHAFEAGRLEARLRAEEAERNRWRDECDEWRMRAMAAEAERSGFKVLAENYEAHLPELEAQRDHLREQLKSLQHAWLASQQVIKNHLRELRTKRDALRDAMRAEVDELRAQLRDPVGYARSRELRASKVSGWS